MGMINKFMRRSTVRGEIVMLLCVMTLVPLIVSCILIYYFVGDSYQKRLEADMETTLGQIVLNIENNMDGVYRLSNVIAHDIRLQNIHMEQLTPFKRYQLLREYLMPRLTSALHASDSWMRISVYLDNDDVPEYYNVSSDEYMNVQEDPTRNADRYEIFNIKRARARDWVDDDGYCVGAPWRRASRDAQYGNISYFQTIMSMDYQRGVGIIRVNMRGDDLFNAINIENLPFSYLAKITNRENERIAANCEEFPLEGSRYYFMSRSIFDGLFTLTTAVSIEETQRDMQRIITIFFSVILVMTILLLTFGYRTSRRMSDGVGRIMTGLGAFQSGNMDARVEYDAGVNNELSQIAVSVNNFMSSIQNMIKWEYQAELAKLQLEKNMLQAQINPHFLYNILSTIGNLAMVNENATIRRIVVMLADFYRSTLTNLTFITLSEELNQVTQYIKIMSIKYQDRLLFNISIPDKIMHAECPPFILQPFVENSIRHAWVNDYLRISINGRLDSGVIVIVINDDGKGFDLRNNDIQIDGHYGINNVRRRIQLQYGEQYGVDIHSAEDRGTEVALRFPYHPVV